MLDVGISSTLRIAGSWGLVPARAARAKRAAPQPTAFRPAAPHAMSGTDVGRVIEDALRSAGLMR